MLRNGSTPLYLLFIIDLARLKMHAAPLSDDLGFKFVMANRYRYFLCGLTFLAWVGRPNAEQLMTSYLLNDAPPHFKPIYLPLGYLLMFFMCITEICAALLRAAASAATRAPAFTSPGSGARRQQHVDNADSSSFPSSSPLLSLPDAVMAQVLLPRLDMRSALCLDAVCTRLRRSVGDASRASVDFDAPLNAPILLRFTPAVLRSVCARSGRALRSLSIATVPLSCGAVLHTLSCAPNVERLATWRGPVALPDAYLACTPHAAGAMTARLLVWAPPHTRRLLAIVPRLPSFSGAVAASIHALPALLSSLPTDGDVRLISTHRGEWVRNPPAEMVSLHLTHHTSP